MKNKRGVRRYFKAYKVSNITAMIRNNRRTPEVCEDRMDNRAVVISGATSGIGYHTARKYASMGATLYCINRNPVKSEKLKAEIESEFGVPCNIITADLGRMEDIDHAVRELQKLEVPIEVIIHNAGAYLTRQELTKEGFDKVFVVHFLSSFIMNMKLDEKLRVQESARIILVNSEGHRFEAWGLHLDDLDFQRRRYSAMRSYGAAKLAQLQSLIPLGDYFAGSGVTINAMHPGAVKSDTGGENGRLYRWFKKHIFDKTLRPTQISSDSLYYLGVSPEVKGINGKFFNLTTLEDPAPPAVDREAAMELWSKTLEMTGLKDPLQPLS